MKADDLIEQLKRKTGLSTDGEIADFLGVTRPVITQWRKKGKNLSALQVANALVKAADAAKRHAHSDAVKPIVEFFPIDPTPSGRTGRKLEVFKSGKSAGKFLEGLKDELLSTKTGLYIFYDTRGKALYAGQTKKQNIWKEMNDAFNRTRSAQVMTLVKHPTNNVEFRAAHEKVRQPVDQNLKLHDLAQYFSVYSVVEDMVDDLEALLVRAFPNDLLNLKMEKFGKRSRSSADKKK